MKPIHVKSYNRLVTTILAPLIVKKANEEMQATRIKYKEDVSKLILEADMRHASVRNSKNSTMVFIHWPTGKVFWVRSETHADNKGAASSKVRLFKSGMKEMILDEGLKLAEIIHDDCTTISKFIQEVVSFII